ncbi:MAG: hypothetical protein JWM95_3177 [Gemmatimonadetes bacterium]|nr:hypothetical protein [Gemmatimonadota bacterium]
MRARNRIAIALAVALACLGGKARAQVSDVIRGRVTATDNAPIEGVNVRAVSYQGNITRTARTDRSGRFTIIFVNGEGDYWLDFTKLGFAPKRFEIKKVGDEEVMMADTRMTTTIATLDEVNVVGQRNRALPNRNAPTADVGGGERPLTNNGVPADQAGNLAAMAATLAGIQLIPGLEGAADMYSLLGLSGDQNNTTFNGLGSGISTLPPDILATTSIRPYTFDPSSGGFSGAQIAIQTLPGSNFSRRTVNNVDIAPPLEWADETADAQGLEYTNMRVGGNAAGAISTDKLFYNASYNVGRRFNDVQSLFNTNALGLAAGGVAGDSATRLLGIMDRLHIPATAAGASNLQTVDVIQGTANFDLMPSSSGTGHSFTLGSAGNYQRSRPVSRGSLLLTTPAHGGTADFWGANVALVHANYFWFGVLEKTTLGFAASSNATNPYVLLPEGNVRVNSALADGTSSVKSLLFGGSSVASALTSRAVQLNNQLSWYTEDNKHTLKLTSSLMLDAFTNDQTPSLLGTFVFNSLADFEANSPSSYARTLARNERSGRQMTGAMSLGDYWRPSPSVQVQYGLRVDANRFLSTPSFNQAVLSAFGLRNDVVPNDVYLSPRLGLQWYYGSSPTIAYAPGAARPPRAVVHLGIGMFQNVAPAQLISTAVSTTGLSNSAQSITCVGTAVPFPDWNAFVTDPGSIPARCADGSAGTMFSTSAPGVALFDPSYRQPRSLRAAGDWSSPVLDNRFVLGVQAIVNASSTQQGFVDANLNPVTRFVLANEGGRPVFADVGAIVPGTGSITASAARISPLFQRVLLQRSDLHSSSRQLTVNVKPVTANAKLKWDFTYTLLGVNEQYNGFTSTTGNPFDIGSGATLQGGHHAATLRWSDFPIFDIVYVSAALQWQSGPRYTPSIAGDVNGDGFGNDRAFVFDPATTTDVATASAMHGLLATGSSSARECLQHQLGRLSERGSCQAPWTSVAGVQVKFNPARIGLPKRVTIALTVQNPMGIADLALHGSNDIRGWGLNIPPDQNLLYVRGFDPVTRQFRYDVNQRFGSTRPQQSARQALPYVSISVGIDVGIPRERQLLTQRLDAGRVREGNKAGAEVLKQFGTSSIPNPMDMILQQSDSLHLTRVQADSLATLSHRYASFADSIWTPVARYFETLPDAYRAGEAYDRYVGARERTVDFLLTLVPLAKAILTDAQRRKLPPQLANYLDERVLRFLRSSTAGDNSAVVMR